MLKRQTVCQRLQDHCSTPPTTLSKKQTRAVFTPKRTPDLAIPDSSNLMALGALFVLPRELWDEIYSHVCDDGFSFSENFSHQYHQKWIGWGSLSMLQTCKPMRDEFLIILYSQGIFKLCRSFRSLKIKRSDIPFLDDISNVEITMNLLSTINSFYLLEPRFWNEGRNAAAHSRDILRS